jgi:hypothetical protein
MIVTAQNIFDNAMSLIDEILDSGLISSSDTATYTARSPKIINMGQNELMALGDFYSTHTLSNKPINPQVGTGFVVTEHIDTDIIFEATGSKAYYFEVDSEATVYIEKDTGSGWNTYYIAGVPSTVTYFTAYSGLISSNATDRIRIRFTGGYHYRITNVALFKESFNSVSKIPVYRPYFKVTLPIDLKYIHEVVLETGDKYYKEPYKLEGKRDLYVSYYFEGNMRVIYKPVPTTITALTQTLEIDDITAITVLPYHLAYHLLSEENPTLALELKQQYKELKAQAYTKSPASETEILDYYDTTLSY